MNRFKLFIVFLLAATSVAAQQKTYFVSPTGNDAADGLSVFTAWKTLDKINSIEFLPGDKILLESGKIWYGQLKLKGSGTENQPILISSYGGNKDRLSISAKQKEPVFSLTTSHGGM